MHARKTPSTSILEQAPPIRHLDRRRCWKGAKSASRSATGHEAGKSQFKLHKWNFRCMKCISPHPLYSHSYKGHWS